MGDEGVGAVQACGGGLKGILDDSRPRKGPATVRYPEAKIKEAILHPDIEIRDRAVRYFGKSFSPDISIMPLVIKAVETYGRQEDTYRMIGAASD